MNEEKRIINHVEFMKYCVPTKEESFDYLKRLCLEGVEKKYLRKLNKAKDKYSEDYIANYKKKILTRLNEELDVVNKMRYIDYFLIVYDITCFAKENDILLRFMGNCSSLIFYLLDITCIDPIKYGLRFDTLLDDKDGFPLILFRTSNDSRRKMIEYIFDKYPKDDVRAISLHSTKGLKYASMDDCLNSETFRIIISDNMEEKLNIDSENIKSSFDLAMRGIIEINFHEDRDNIEAIIHSINMKIENDLMSNLKKDFLYQDEDKEIADTMIKNAINKVDYNEIPEDNIDAINFMLSIYYNKYMDLTNCLKTIKLYNKDFAVKSFVDLLYLSYWNTIRGLDPRNFLQNKNQKCDGLFSDINITDILKDTYGDIIYKEQLYDILERIPAIKKDELKNIVNRFPALIGKAEHVSAWSHEIKLAYLKLNYPDEF